MTRLRIPEATERASNQRKPVLSGVRNALRILDVFTERRQVLGVSEIARCVGLPKSTTSRLAATLHSEGFLSATPSGKYRLSLHMLDFSRVAAKSHNPYDAASKVLAGLRASTGFSAHFAILDGCRLVQTHRVTSNDIELFGESHTSLPMHATSTGQAILAFAKPTLLCETLSSTLTPCTNATITRAEQLRSVLSEARLNGYACTRDEFVDGTGSIAAPILDQTGYAVAAITLVALSHQISERTVTRAKTSLLEGARAVSMSALF